MENIEEKMKELEDLKSERARAYKKLIKRRKISRICLDAREIDHVKKSENLAIAGLPIGASVGAVVAGVRENEVVSEYLSKPEYVEKLRELFETTGYNNVYDLAVYLTGSDTVASALYESSGACEYFATYAIGMCSMAALAGCAIFMSAPYIYKGVCRVVGELNFNKLQDSTQKYNKLNRECEWLEYEIYNALNTVDPALKKNAIEDCEQNSNKTDSKIGESDFHESADNLAKSNCDEDSKSTSELTLDSKNQELVK